MVIVTLARRSTACGLRLSSAWAAADAHPDWRGSHILMRLVDQREIAYAILFLVSDEASFITGENLMVDGGYTAK